MLELFSKYFKKDFPEQEKYTFYLAISGGKDSMVLSHLLIQAGIDHKLLHCNFNLRSAESDQDQKFVENHSVEHGLELKIKSFDTTKESEKRNINIQLTARDLRYEWFNTILDLDEHKKSILLTAHHLDDSIETFFINLLRGTGLKGLSGIPKRNGSTYRPLLDFALSDILTFVDSHKIDYRQDSSNNENKYLRNKIRHSLIPLVEQLSPEIRKKFKALFKESIEHQTFLEVEKVNFKLEQVIQNKNYSSISKNLFKDDLNVVTKEFLKDLDIRRSNINEFVKFSKSINGSLFITDRFELLTSQNEIHFRPKDSFLEISPIEISLEDFPSSIYGFQFKFSILDDFDNQFHNKSNLVLTFNELKLPLTIRKWRIGDKIVPFGMNNEKLISDILINNKINRFEKDEITVLTDSSDRILAIPGLLISEETKISRSTQNILSINKV